MEREEGHAKWVEKTKAVVQKHMLSWSPKGRQMQFPIVKDAQLYQSTKAHQEGVRGNPKWDQWVLESSVRQMSEGKDQTRPMNVKVNPQLTVNGLTAIAAMQTRAIINKSGIHLIPIMVADPGRADCEETILTFALNDGRSGLIVNPDNEQEVAAFAHILRSKSIWKYVWSAKKLIHCLIVFGKTHVDKIFCLETAVHSLLIELGILSPCDMRQPLLQLHMITAAQLHRKSTDAFPLVGLQGNWTEVQAMARKGLLIQKFLAKKTSSRLNTINKIYWYGVHWPIGSIFRWIPTKLWTNFNREEDFWGELELVGMRVGCPYITLVLLIYEHSRIMKQCNSRHVSLSTWGYYVQARSMAYDIPLMLNQVQGERNTMYELLREYVMHTQLGVKKEITYIPGSYSHVMQRLKLIVSNFEELMRYEVENRDMP